MNCKVMQHGALRQKIVDIGALEMWVYREIPWRRIVLLNLSYRETEQWNNTNHNDSQEYI